MNGFSEPRAGIILVLLGLLLPSGTLQAEGGPVAKDLGCARCNLVLLNFDFFRADYIGLLSGRGNTPNIDHFFRNALVFENVSSPAGSSYRGNLSVLTATDPHIYDIDVGSFHTLKAAKKLGPWKRIFEGSPSVSEVLSGHGYQTSYLNKGIRSGRNTFLDRGFNRYRQFKINTLFEDLLPRFRDFLQTAREPFLLLFHPLPTRLHRAYYPRDRTRVEDEGIIYRAYEVDGRPYGFKVVRDRRLSLEKQRASEHKIYAQQLTYADDRLAEIFPLLSKVEDNSIIVLYSTHGTQLGDKEIFASNGVSFQSCVHVPLIIKHPAVHRQVRIATPVSLIDLVPTLYEFLGVPVPEHATGTSLVPLLGSGKYGRRYLVGKNDFDEYVRSGRWKLIVRYDKERKLYNLESDPLEKIDRYADNPDRGRWMEYVIGFGGEGDRVVRHGQWKLTITDRRSYELYDLDADPRETTNLAALHPARVDALAVQLKEHHSKARLRMLELAGE